MKGKSYSMPLGMIFRKYYCAKCGEVLKKELTHRVVTRNDKDYYEFHDRGTFPLHDHDVYNYRFKCPNCHARISYNEQCIIERIQKQQGTHMLAGSEIKTYYNTCKEQHKRSTLIGSIGFAVGFILLFCGLYYLFGTEKTSTDLVRTAVYFLAFGTFAVIGVIRSYKGQSHSMLRRSYSYEEKMQLENLHTYSTNNRRFVAISDKCYCFYCRACVDHSEIVDYLKDEQTAVCPKCGIDSIIPDRIDETVDESIIAKLHAYWF